MARVYTTGKYARAICDRCGLEYKLNSLIKEWTGLKVCNECHEPKHPQLHIGSVSDPQALKEPRPEETAEGGKDADLASASAGVDDIFGGTDTPYMTDGAGMFGESG